MNQQDPTQRKERDLTLGKRVEPKRARRMKTSDKLLAFVLIIVLVFVFYLALDANKYSATVLVIEGEGKVGVNPTTEALDFGDLSPGTTAVRRVEIANNTSIPMFIAVLRFGSITDLMKLDQNYFVLTAGAEDRIEFSVHMPASAPIGEVLDGRVFLFRVPGPWRES